jgi:chromate transporter
MTRAMTSLSDAEPIESATADHGVTFGEAARVWARVAALSFGGPAGQIATMHRILVEEKRWIGEARFLHALNYCMLLPGPEAQQLAIYIGWLLHRTAGGLIAGTLFVLPGAVAIMALSLVYAAFGNVAVVQALFFGLKAAVLAIVLEAVVRIGRRALKNRMMLGLAAAAFVGIFFFDVPFPLIVLMAGLIGFVGGRAGLPQFGIGSSQGSTVTPGLTDADSALGAAMPAHARPSLAWSLRIGTIYLVLWLGRSC